MPQQILSSCKWRNIAECHILIMRAEAVECGESPDDDNHFDIFLFTSVFTALGRGVAQF